MSMPLQTASVQTWIRWYEFVDESGAAKVALLDASAPEALQDVCI
jgi:hypothetical protein